MLLPVFVDFQNTVLNSLANIQTTNDQILLTMQEILRYHKKIALDKLIAPENLPAFPLKTYEEFLSLEKLLKEDPSVNQYLVREQIFNCFQFAIHILCSEYRSED